MRADPKRRQEYQEAWRAWQDQLGVLHRVLLDGEPMEPPKLKGLLNRETRAKARYDQARLRLLGLSDGETEGSLDAGEP